jgi:ABC-type multidrug transport system permease subunit
MFSNQLSFSASINVLLQVPLQAPVMKRELANKMYTPTAYFLGRFVSNMIIQVAYPLIMILILFWNIGIITDSNNFWWLMAFGLIGNFIYCGQGYFIGIMVNNEDSAKLANLLVIMVMFCTNGVLCNMNSASAFVKFISSYSPSRYNCEGFLRRMI